MLLQGKLVLVAIFLFFLPVLTKGQAFSVRFKDSLTKEPVSDVKADNNNNLGHSNSKGLLKVPVQGIYTFTHYNYTSKKVEISSDSVILLNVKPNHITAEILIRDQKDLKDSLTTLIEFNRFLLVPNDTSIVVKVQIDRREDKSRLMTAFFALNLGPNINLYHYTDFVKELMTDFFIKHYYNNVTSSLVRLFDGSVLRKINSRKFKISIREEKKAIHYLVDNQRLKAEVTYSFSKESRTLDSVKTNYYYGNRKRLQDRVLFSVEYYNFESGKLFFYNYLAKQYIEDSPKRKLYYFHSMRKMVFRDYNCQIFKDNRYNFEGSFSYKEANRQFCGLLDSLELNDVQADQMFKEVRESNF